MSREGEDERQNMLKMAEKTFRPPQAKESGRQQAWEAACSPPGCVRMWFPASVLPAVPFEASQPDPCPQAPCCLAFFFFLFNYFFLFLKYFY